MCIRDRFYPYRSTNVQALSEADFKESVKFSNFTLDKFDGVLNSVLWTDESMFCLTPKAECLSGAIWFQKNKIFFPKKLHEQKLHVWFGFSFKF